MRRVLRPLRPPRSAPRPSPAAAATMHTSRIFLLSSATRSAGAWRRRRSGVAQSGAGNGGLLVLCCSTACLPTTCQPPANRLTLPPPTPGTERQALHGDCVRGTAGGIRGRAGVPGVGAQPECRRGGGGRGGWPTGLAGAPLHRTTRRQPEPYLPGCVEPGTGVCVR